MGSIQQKLNSHLGLIQLFVFLQDMFYKCTNCMQFWQVYEFEKITSCFIFIELFVAHSLRELEPACAYTHAQGCPRNSSRSILSLKFFIRKIIFYYAFLTIKIYYEEGVYEGHTKGQPLAFLRVHQWYSNML